MYKRQEQEQARTEQRISELSGLKSDVSAYVEGLDQHLTEVAGELERLEGEIEMCIRDRFGAFKRI